VLHPVIARLWRKPGICDIRSTPELTKPNQNDRGSPRVVAAATPLPATTTTRPSRSRSRRSSTGVCITQKLYERCRDGGSSGLSIGSSGLSIVTETGGASQLLFLI
jgi:hypothetical protein